MDSFVRSLSVNPQPTVLLFAVRRDVHSLGLRDGSSSLSALPARHAVFTPGLAHIQRWQHGNSYLLTTDDDILENEGQLLINGAPEFELPNFQQIDPADLHYILISNFSQIFALPYLINERNFHGKIFATAPTVQLARDVFQDMSAYLTTYSTSLKAEKWKVKEVNQMLPPVLQSTRLHLWKSLCSMEAFETALKRIEIINFRQTVPLENSLVITAYSSGFAMGSCNWSIQSPEEKICYLADSSTLSTHVSPIDYDDIKNADVMIVSALNMDPARTLNDSLDKISKTVLDTVKDGGNVLIPFSRVDLLIDLLEYLYLYMDQLPTNIPINVVSSSARSMLFLSQVFSEWLTKDYRDKAYLPEEPFIHGEMLRNSRLQIYPSVDGKFSESFKSPCIVFCSHYSLRFGPGVHLMSQWKSSQKNSVIFTDPEFHFEEVLAPYRPFAMRVSYCPMDTRLTPSQLSKVIAMTEPKSLVIHDRYLTPFDLSQDPAEQIVRCHSSTKILPYRENVDIPIPVRYRWIDTIAGTAFLASIPMSEVAPSNGDSGKDENKAPPTIEPGKVLVGRIYGNLRALDNQYIIEPPTGITKAPLEPAHKFPPLSFSRPDAWKLARYLKREGFTDVLHEGGNGDTTDTGSAKLVSIEAGFTITITDGRTEVTTANPTRELRTKLKRVLEMVRLPEEPVVVGVQLENPNVFDVLPAPEGFMDVEQPGGSGKDLAGEMKALK
ncbi:Integrator complex subunit 9 [Hypsibius exemplaris]|uniref:Integrator complex subunit 9 n=1 Tax=Hypsibius exemplaris TaxID=2072580 RepID=A0A9X6NHM9_HYPEX|nr:Integrator complex subunit 9 [Hypsibius exemplaris]